MPLKYRMYIDEVGNSDLNSSENPLHRFLSLTGVIIDLEYVGLVLHSQMEKLKSKYFGSHPDDPVILHRKEILNAKTPFEVLRDATVRSRFDREILALLERWKYTVISVCLDKKGIKTPIRYGDMIPIIIALQYFLKGSLSFRNKQKPREMLWRNHGAGKKICD